MVFPFRRTRLLATTALLAGLLGSAAPGAALAQNTPPTLMAPPSQANPGGPAGFACPGFIEPGHAPDDRPGWELRWDWGWEVFNADPIFGDYKPMGIAIDSTCNVYVGGYSPLGGRIVKISPQGGTLAQMGTNGKAVGQFERLEAIGVDGAGNLYAADAGNNRIQKLSPAGDVTAVWADRFGCADVKVTCHVLPDDSNFNGNVVLAVDAAGTIFAGDSYQGVKKLSPAGPIVSKWGTAVPESAIMGVSLDAAENVLLAHSKHKIVVQSATGTTIAEWGSPGREPHQLDYPNGVAADGEGNIYVADTDNQRIKKLSPTGETIMQWGRCADGDAMACVRFGTGDQAGEFAQPRHLAVNGRGEIVVADHFNYRVQVYKAVPVWVNTMPDTMTESESAG